MAEETLNPTPDVAATPAAATPVAASAPSPDASAPAPAPAASVPDVGSALGDALGQARQFEGSAQTATQKAADLASTPMVSPQVPHARLLAMVQGLATGLSAFGTAMATHGQEGGAKEVAQIEGEQQQQKIQAQEAAIALRNQQIQQQLTVADTNHKMAQNILLMATMPDELTKSHMSAQAAKLDVVGKGADIHQKAWNDFLTTGDWNQYQNTIGQLAGAQGAPAGQAPAGQAPAGGAAPVGGAAAPSVPPMATTTWKSAVDGAALAYPNDSVIKQQQTVFTDPNSTPQQQAMAARMAANRQDALDKAAGSKEKQEQSDIVAKLGAPTALAEPGSQAAIQARIDDPTVSEVDKVRLRALLPLADIAQKNAATLKQREQQATELAQQGNVEDAARLLVNRGLTLSELKTRPGSTPKYVSDVITAAQKLDPTYKAATAEAQAKIAGSEANQQFFGNTDSLLVKNGTLDQLEIAGRNLGNTQVPAINTFDQWLEAASGSGPLAAYAAAALGVADDYSKVMSGGAGSDTSRDQALHIIARNLSPEGRQAAVAQIKKSVSSQREGRLGVNPYLRDAFPAPEQSTPEELAVKAMPFGTAGVAPDKKNPSKWYYHDAQGKILGPAPTPQGR